METLDLTNSVNKITDFQEFVNKSKNNCGGWVDCIIIPPTFKDIMLNVRLENKPEDEFYHYGWYNEFRFPIYIDKTLTDCFYFIGNNKCLKIKVINGC